MQTKICVLSAPPEIEVEEKFFNKACCFLPDLGICDFIHLPEKGLSAMTCYTGEISSVSCDILVASSVAAVLAVYSPSAAKEAAARARGAIPRIFFILYLPCRCVKHPRKEQCRKESTESSKSSCHV